MTRARLWLLLGLLDEAIHWRLTMLRVDAGYWLRPFCWRRDDRHSRWAHRRCLARPCVVDIRTLGEVDLDFERALQRMVERPPSQTLAREEWR